MAISSFATRIQDESFNRSEFGGLRLCRERKSQQAVETDWGRCESGRGEIAGH